MFQKVASDISKVVFDTGLTNVADIEKQIFIMESKFENALGIEKRKQLLEILKELAQNLE